MRWKPVEIRRLQTSAPRPVVNILGVRVDRVDLAQTLDQIGAWIGESAPPPCRQICTVNPEFVMRARRDPEVAMALRNADLCVADGVGIVWAAQLLRAPLRERVTGSDGIYQICERAAREGWRIYLLGAAPGVAQQAAQRLRALYAGVEIVGTHSGTPAEADWPDIHQRLWEARPDILLVAFGHPKQELWIDQHRKELPTAVAMGMGGTFDFVAGITVRAPHWMRQLGLEWLHRLIQQPWRWRRMLALPRFALLVLWQVAGGRWRMARDKEEDRA